MVGASAKPHFSPAFYCGDGSGNVYRVALRRAPRRTFEYVCGALGRAPCIHARLRRLATKPGEKCGLKAFQHRPGFIRPLQSRQLGHRLKSAPTELYRGFATVPDSRPYVFRRGLRRLKLHNAGIPTLLPPTASVGCACAPPPCSLLRPLLNRRYETSGPA